MDSNQSSAISAEGESEFIRAGENTHYMVSPPLAVRSPIAFRIWLQVATNTASLVSSMDRGRKGGRFYGDAAWCAQCRGVAHLRFGDAARWFFDKEASPIVEAITPR